MSKNVQQILSKFEGGNEMSAIPQFGKKLSLSEKFSRLGIRLRTPEWRRYGKLLFVGKLAGVGLTLVVMAAMSYFFFGRVYAADAEVKAADVINPVNTAWTLIAAFLVFGMQVGFTMLEAGFCRSRETVNVLMECVVDTCLCGILFYAIGFAFMFSHGNGFIGYHWFFLQGAPATYETTGVAFLAVWLFFLAACAGLAASVAGEHHNVPRPPSESDNESSVTVKPAERRLFQERFMR